MELVQCNKQLYKTGEAVRVYIRKLKVDAFYSKAFIALYSAYHGTAFSTMLMQHYDSNRIEVVDNDNIVLL